jgi:hypothetical protein
METSQLVLILVALIVGLSKGGVIGPIAGALILPLLSQTMSVPQAVGVTLPLLMIGDLFALRAYWKDWDWHYVRLLLPVAVAGVLIGTLLLATLSDEVLRRLLGLFTLGAVVYKLISDSIQQLEYQPRSWHGWLAGGLSGFASALANNGGPPITAYLLLNRVPPVSFIGTITLYFAILNWLKVPGFIQADIIDLPLLLSVLWIIPAIPLGVWVGRRVIGWINQTLFERFMLVLLTIAGLSLLV